MEGELDALQSAEEVEKELRNKFPPGEFRPAAFYDIVTDSLTLWFADEASYAHRVDALLTVYYSQLDGAERIVGGVLKGVSGVFDSLEELGMLSSTSGLDQLKLVFSGLYCATDTSRPLARKMLSVLTKLTIENKVEFEFVASSKS